MMLATSAVGAIGSACSVYALVASLEATSSTAVLVAAGLVESEEVLAMEYSTSRVRAAAVAPPVDIVAEEEERTGQELFECGLELASQRDWRTRTAHHDAKHMRALRNLAEHSVRDRGCHGYRR